MNELALSAIQNAVGDFLDRDELAVSRLCGWSKKEHRVKLESALIDFINERQLLAIEVYQKPGGAVPPRPPPERGGR